ncbi:MAG: hypothetical protein AAF206_27035, partial [Bacteroidota bacterium]
RPGKDHQSLKPGQLGDIIKGRFRRLGIQRSFPDLFMKIQALMDWQLSRFTESIHFNIARGAIRDLADQEIHFLARMLVQQVHSWPATHDLWARDGTQLSAREYLWQIMLPYASESGKKEVRVMLDRRVSLNELNLPS